MSGTHHEKKTKAPSLLAQENGRTWRYVNKSEVNFVFSAKHLSAELWLHGLRRERFHTAATQRNSFSPNSSILNTLNSFTMCIYT